MALLSTITNSTSAKSNGTNVPNAHKPIVTIDFRTDRGQTVLIADLRWKDGLAQGCDSAREVTLEFVVVRDKHNQVEFALQYEPQVRSVKTVTGADPFTHEVAGIHDAKLSGEMLKAAIESILEQATEDGIFIKRSELETSLDVSRYENEMFRGPNVPAFRSPLATLTELERAAIYQDNVLVASLG